MGGPLDGIVVVSLEQAVAAPFASRQLADLGATVIKVERPGGDFARSYDRDVNGMSTHFAWTNRGKHSVVLDLRDASDRATFDDLVAGADVFVHNIAPASSSRLAVDAATLRGRRPELIVCEISGYGAGGPLSADKAYDLAVQAEAGAFDLCDGGGRIGFAAADVSAGMYALSGILAALFHRERTGEGSTVEVAMLDGLVEWLSAQVYAAHYGAVRAARPSRRHPGIAPYGTFDTKDGRTILLAVQNDREWSGLAAEFLGDASLGDDPRFRTNVDRIEHVEEVEDLVAARLAAVEHDDAVAALNAIGIAVADVSHLGAVWEHRQLRARRRFVTVDSPVGSVEMLASPFSGSLASTPSRGIPALGEHDPVVVDMVLKRGRARR